jgi:hypothetical protein
MAIPFDPSHPLVAEVNTDLQQEQFRQRVRELHALGTPLTQMVKDLGLENMSTQIRDILEGLEPHVVAGIRAATLAMLDGDVYEMPLDCIVSEAEVNAGAAVHIEVDDAHHRKSIHVRPKKPKP